MNPHRHLSPEEILDAVSSGEVRPGLAECETCASEAAAVAGFLNELRRAHVEPMTGNEWDDLLLRRRIREAVAREAPHGRPFFDRFTILRPAFVSVLVAGLALLVWSPLTRNVEKGAQVASIAAGDETRIPAWVPLPDEAEDEGLAVLAEWTPNADEVSIASCHFSCLSGLSEHEEERLLNTDAVLPRTPQAQASPL